MKSEEKNKNADDWFNLDALLVSLSMTPQQRMDWLEQMNEFLDKVMPKKSKEIWEQLKAEGF